jgi:hypothetical protein
MRSCKTWRIGWLVMLVAALLTVSELKGAPRVTVQSPTGLYLLAQYKLAVGDAGSGLELLDRALAGRDSLSSSTDLMNTCSACIGVAIS